MGFRQGSRRKRRNKQPKSQVEYKFAVDERVLCYEPDLKKARVLYDSKVLEVVERKNHGKTNVEYKIHFFGWNSSWDRYVDEDCVLKDTDENRALQKQLKESADELLQTHLKKRKRKKTLSELLKEATKGKGGKNVNLSHSKTKTDEESSRSHSSSDSSDQESSEEDDDDGEISRIVLTNHMRSILERDCHNITVKKLLVRIPVDISVVCIFEAYVKDLGFRELRNVLDQREAFLKSNNTQPLPPGLSASLAQASAAAGAKFPSGKVQPKFLIEPWLEEINRIYRKVRQAQEIIYGLKTIFDYMLYLMLLYNVENEQYETSKTMRPKVPIVNSSLIIPNLPPQVQPFQTSSRSDKQEPSTSRRSEKTDGRRKVADPVGTSKSFADMLPTPTAPTRSQSKALQPQNAEKLINDAALWQRKVDKFIKDLDSWRMLPEECFQQDEPDPCMLYGLIHLLRLFVKLPDILNRMLIPRRKVRIIAHHVNQMIEHIEACYVFSTKELYVQIVKSAYEEDQMRVDAAKSDEEGPSGVKVEVDTDKSLYSTRNLRLVTNLKTKPPLAKVVEVPLSSTDGGLEEHQLTVSMDTSLPLPTPVEDTEDISQPASEPNDDLTIEVEVVNLDDIKQEPASPPVERTSSIQQPKKIESVKKSAPRKPALPVLTKHRQMRESAANAAVKNAHIFASQQNYSSRSFSSTVIKKEPKEKEAASLKRKLPDGEHSSPSKRITRTCSKSASNDNSTGKLISPVRKKDEQKGVSPNQLTKDVPRSSPDRLAKVKIESDDLKKRSGSRTSSSDEKSLPKKTTSTPRSETGSPHKEMGSTSAARTPQKITPSFSTTIRLRSKSGERQLRSKGSLVNAFSLPMQTSPRSSKSGPDKSPKRRESSSIRDSCNQQQQRSPSPKNAEPVRSLRSRR